MILEVKDNVAFDMSYMSQSLFNYQIIAFQNTPAEIAFSSARTTRHELCQIVVNSEFKAAM